MPRMGNKNQKHDSGSFVSRTLKKINGEYVCLVCGHAVTNQNQPHLGECLCSTPHTKQKFFTHVLKVANFAASAAKHLAAGMPKATDEQVAERFAICQGCEHFDGKACRKCGCPVVRERKFVSKLSWANESCPVGKWGPVAS